MSEEKKIDLSLNKEEAKWLQQMLLREKLLGNMPDILVDVATTLYNEINSWEEE